MWVAFAKLLTFSQQKYLWLDIVLTRIVNIFTIYKLVKLTMLWTTGLWYLSHLLLYCLIFCAVAVFGRSIRYWDRLVSERQLIALHFVRYLVTYILSVTVCLPVILVSLVGYVLCMALPGIPFYDFAKWCHSYRSLSPIDSLNIGIGGYLTALTKNKLTTHFSLQCIVDIKMATKYVPSTMSADTHDTLPSISLSCKSSEFVGIVDVLCLVYEMKYKTSNNPTNSVCSCFVFHLWWASSNIWLSKI